MLETQTHLQPRRTKHGLKQLFASIVMIECIWMIDEHDPKICTSRV